MQNKCETQFKIQNNTFSKIEFYLLEKNKEVNKKESKKPSGHFNTKVFCFENVEKHEIGDAEGDKKKRKKNNLNQMEHGTRKTCARKIKTRGKRKTQREQSEKRKKGTNK